jgi:hypothetical protein
MDRTSLVTLGILLALLMISYPVLAAAAGPVVIERDGQGRPTVIIEQGRGKDAGLVKVTQIHYVKPDGRPQPPNKQDTCYKLAQWRWITELPVEYIINPNYDLPRTTIMNAIENACTAWDDETLKGLFSTPATGEASWDSYDGINSISFGNYGSPGVIAVTLTWYTQGKTKEAVESDILFDTDYTWGDATKSPGVMDLQNIATHEIGHTLGLSDTYSTSCQNVTMYGYSDYGETSKRTLDIPDITGLQKIYGS